MAKYKITKQQLVELKEKMINLPPLVKKALVGEPINTPDEAQQGVLIYETPDGIIDANKHIYWSDGDAIAFGFEHGKAYVGYNNEMFFDSINVGDDFKDRIDKIKWQDVERMMMHSGIADFYKFLYGEEHTHNLISDRSGFGYPGRLWVNKKIISFWEYPNKEKLHLLIKMLRDEINNIYGINIDFSAFEIEIKQNEYVADLDIDDEDYEPDMDWAQSQKNGILIPIKDFISSNDATEHEMQAIHLLPSDEKKNTPQMQAARDADAERLANKFNGNVSQAEWNAAKNKYQGESKKIKITSSQLNEIKNYLLKEEQNLNKLFHASRTPIDNIASYSDYKKEKSGYYEGMFFYDDLSQYQNYFNHQKYNKDKYYFYEISVGNLNLYNLEDADKLKDESRKGGFPANNGSGYYESRYLDSIGYDGIKNRTEIILFHPEKFEFKLLSSPEMNEEITIPVTTGDTIMMGKFKNKKTVVKTIDKDAHGMPTINGKQAATFRTIKEDKDSISLKYNGEHINLSNEDIEAMPFVYYHNKVYVGYTPYLGDSYVDAGYEDSNYETNYPNYHEDIPDFYRFINKDNENYHIDLPMYRNDFTYIGRVWLDSDVVSFYKYPEDKSKMKQIMGLLSDEIYEVYGERFNFNKTLVNILDGDGKETLIPMSEYVGSDNVQDDKMETPHLLPADKKINNPQFKSSLDAKYAHIGNKLGNVTQAEYNHYKRYGMGESVIKEEQKNDLILYHGTKHNFLKFETTNIGGGEGNQSFGWGIYFTDNKSVSEFYANLLGGDDGLVYTINISNGNFMSWYGKLESDFCNKLTTNMLQNGIGELPVNRMLNNGKVEVNKLPTKEAIEYYPNGKFLYENLALALGGDKMASAKLNELGVDGVYYPIGQFLKKGDKSHANGTNYVLFSEDKINIVKQEKVNNINELNENNELDDTKIVGDNIEYTTDSKILGQEVGLYGSYSGKDKYGNRKYVYKDKGVISDVKKEDGIYYLTVKNNRGGVLNLFKNEKTTNSTIWTILNKGRIKQEIIISRFVWDILKGKSGLTEATESDVNLSSFKPKKELNEKFWLNNKLKPIVRKRLLKIADDFIDFLKVDIKKVEDILFLGSLANYNWSSYSDVDLHLLVDFKTINKDVELVRDYFDSKRNLWNNEHDNLKIFGLPIEIYVQDKNDENASVGVFSLEKNKWLTKPEVIDDKDFDKKKIKEKAAVIMTDIDDLLSKYKKKPSFNELNTISNKVKKLHDKIKKMRKVGLASEKGETSVGNIVFKVLRRNGYMEKLVDLKTLTYDKINSIK